MGSENLGKKLKLSKKTTDALAIFDSALSAVSTLVVAVVIRSQKETANILNFA